MNIGDRLIDMEYIIEERRRYLQDNQNNVEMHW